LPLRRPAWFFDVDEYGEGLADVGTHVVDLVQWTAFPHRVLDYRTDVKVHSGRHWPTMISPEQFQQVTGEKEFPAALKPHIKDGQLVYLCNNAVHYTLQGVHVKLDILWNWEAPAGAGDLYEASFQGTKSRVEIRQAQDPQVFIIPNSKVVKEEVFAALTQRIDALQPKYPGISLEERGEMAHILIPAALRVGHEAHFAQVTNHFSQYLKAPDTLPAWEKSNMLVKYFICTKGVEMGHVEMAL
jgi:predicted dehydrogenase